MIAEPRGDVVGYATSSRFRHKPAYDSSIESTVCFDHAAVGHGVGSALYVAVFDALAGEDVDRCFAGVALPNPASLALHGRFGFTHVGTFTEVGRKFDRWWDVAWLQRPV